jgi:hypothetical protein
LDPPLFDAFNETVYSPSDVNFTEGFAETDEPLVNDHPVVGEIIHCQPVGLFVLISVNVAVLFCTTTTGVAELLLILKSATGGMLRTLI